MIIGIGADLVSVPRFRRALERNAERLLARLFTAREREECDRRAAPEIHLAARFAGKEAAIKALGTGWGEGLRWREVEILSGGRRAPTLLLSGRAGAVARARGIHRTHVSISHHGDYALAFVVATDDAAPGPSPQPPL